MKKLAYLFLATAMIACGGNDSSDQDGTDIDTAQAHMGHDEKPAGTVDGDTEEAVEPGAVFGEASMEGEAIAAAEVPAMLQEKDSVALIVEGEILSVCQVKGCWMTMKVGDDQTMHVSFRDYGFFVPKDIDGKTCVINGHAFIETQSVADLKHYAEDKGMSQEEIDAITEPETKLSFVADGVVVKDYEIDTTFDAEDAAETEETVID